MRWLSPVLAAAIIFSPVTAYADEIERQIRQTGREAQDFAKRLGESFGANAGTVEGGQFTVPGLEGGQFSPGSAAPFSVNELYPGTSSSGSGGDSRYFFFPDEQTPNPEALKETYESAGGVEGIEEEGKRAKESLWEDANRENPSSLAGAAYKILLNAADSSRPDFSSDPIFKDSYAGMEDFADNFADCSTETDYLRTSFTTRLPDYQMCERIVDRSGVCEIAHAYDASVVSHHSGPYNLNFCGEGCAQVWIGKVGDNYWSGNCTVYEEYTQVLVTNPQAITSVVLDHAKWDDYMQIWIGSPGREELVWQSHEHFPTAPGQGIACDLKTSPAVNPGTDVTRFFRDIAPGSVVSFKMRVSVGGHGEGYGRIRINFNPAQAVARDEWTPESCMLAARGIMDGFATGNFSCIENPADSSGCATINGIQVCESHLKPSPLPGIPSMCRKVRVDASFDFYKGTMECWTDVSGELHCPEINDGNAVLDSCVNFENNPQCGFISQGCVDGARGDSGTCYVHEEKWDCGVDVEVPTVESSTRYECAGPIRCMGDDCLDVTKTANNDLARVMAMLHAAQFMTQDMSCTGLDEDGNPTGEEDVVCRAFAGEPGECKKAVAGVVDCCKTPVDGVSLADYLTLIMQVPKLDGAIMKLGTDADPSAIKGAYQIIRDPVMQGWDTVTQPFASYIENITASTKEFFQPVQQVIDEFIEKIKEKIADITTEVIGNAAATGAGDAAGGAIADQGSQMAADMTSGLVSNAAAFMSFAMTAYTVYVVTMLAIQMIYKCEQKEFELNAKRTLDNCISLGRYCKQRTGIGKSCLEYRHVYCCYNSPLARIINEQVGPQLGLGYGTKKNPVCAGIPLDRLEEVDWSKVNLDEWLAILQANGQFPDAFELELDKLTGAGSALDVDGSRLGAAARTAERFEGLDPDEARRNAADRLWIDTGAPSPSP